MKKIIVEWVPGAQCGIIMKVIESDHPEYVKGFRFDFGYFNVATREGYTIISLPMKQKEKTT